MNRFDEKYIIRLATLDEIPEVMNFIDTYWKKGHILGNNKPFFEYEMVIDGQVNFLVAKRKSNGNIEGILGFLPCSHNADKLDIWGVIWKTIDTATPMLGMELRKRLMDITKARYDIGVGANFKTSIPLLKKIKHYYTAKMKHYYCLSNKKEYVIAKIKHYESHTYNTEKLTNYRVLKTKEELKSFFDFDNDISIPYKDLWYYNRRFYQHPLYNYTVWGLEDNEKSKKAIIVTRQQEYNNAKALRIVDYRGNQSLFAGCGMFLEKALLDCEYVDFYFDGFDTNYVKQAGMIEILDNDTNIIPDYFYPFEQRNVDIWVDASETNQQFTFFKADGDQDRPAKCERIERKEIKS